MGNLSRRRTVFGVMAILAVSGCGTADHPRPERANSGQERPAAPPATARPAPKPEAPTQTTRLLLASKFLVGKNEMELQNILGSPRHVRNEPPAMVWRYVGSVCELDVFFYFDIDNQDFRVLAYKFYPDQATPRAESACIDRIRADKGRPATP